MSLLSPAFTAAHPRAEPHDTRRPLRYLILRAHPSRSRADFYNCQELGLAAYLRREGFEVGLAGVFDDDVGQIVPGLRFHSLRFRPRHPALALISNLAELGLEHYDVVQLTDLCLPGNLQVIRRAPSGVRILMYQGHYPEPLGRARWLRVAQSHLTARALRRRPRALLAKNAAAATFLQRCNLGDAPVVGVGLVADNLLTPASPPPSVTEFIRGSAFTFLYVGHLGQRRPVEWIVPHLRHPALAHASLLVIGGGPALAKVEREGADLIAAGRLKISSHLSQSQLGEVYRRVDAVVLPTRFEILGMVCLESVLFDLPLIASDAAGPRVVAERFPDEVKLIPGGENRTAWFQALCAAAQQIRTRREPDPARIRALSWDEPGRRFARLANRLVGNPVHADAIRHD